MQPSLTFVHITDSHIGPTRDFGRNGAHSLDQLTALVDLINAMPHPPDFVVHTGDVSNDRSPESYTFAAEALSALAVPIYYVNGNHDQPALLRDRLGAPAGDDPDAPLDYAFMVKGDRFLVLDGVKAGVPDPSGRLSEAQLDIVQAEASPDGPPLTVLLHYAPFKMASPWLDDHMLLLNGQDLHQALLPARERLRGVFFGHLHRSAQIVRDGITYTCAPSSAWQYAWRPWHDRPEPDVHYPPAYNVVQYFRGQVVVHQYTLPNGDHG